MTGRTAPALVFVCGPLRHEKAPQVAAHILTAQAAALELVRAGMVPYCPHTHLGGALGQITERQAGIVNRYYLERAAALLVLPGWRASRGSRREVARATALGLPIFESLEQIRQWHRDTYRSRV